MEYTKIPTLAFEEIQLNAGILCETFNPSSGAVTGLLGSTSGGLQAQETVDFLDFGEDIDNCPKNTMELKRIDDRQLAISGNFVSVSPANMAKLAIANSTTTGGVTKITPRKDLVSTDFKDIWLVCDYSDKNTGTGTAGFIAIHMLNGLNTSGFSLTTQDKGKGQFAFSYQAHWSLAAQDTVPYEVYVMKGSASVQAGITLNTHTVTVPKNSTVTLEATTVPDDATVTWATGDGDTATVADGVVAGVAAGNTIITASITQGGVTYNDTCTVIVTA